MLSRIGKSIVKKNIVKNKKKSRRQVLVKGYSKVCAEFQKNRCITFRETLLTAREGSHFSENAFKVL